ncbi:hypothetical protein [Phytohabitans houttuyneae]|uniref:hypothetical protein n=1 Tax=Phytohabitans houttuyneae TaxID=1076126 RepID=UPI0035313A43
MGDRDRRPGRRPAGRRAGAVRPDRAPVDGGGARPGRAPDGPGPDGHTWLTLDAGHNGIGSASCGPGVLPPYLLPAAPARLELELRVL